MKGQYILHFMGDLVGQVPSLVLNSSKKSKNASQNPYSDDSLDAWLVTISINDQVVAKDLEQVKDVQYLSDPAVDQAIGRIKIGLYHKASNSGLIGKVKSSSPELVHEKECIVIKILNNTTQVDFESDELYEHQIRFSNRLALLRVEYKCWDFPIPRPSQLVGYSDLACKTYVSQINATFDEIGLTDNHLGKYGPINLSAWFKHFNENEFKHAVAKNQKIVQYLRIHSIVTQWKLVHVYYESYLHRLPDHLFEKSTKTYTGKETPNLIDL